MAKEDKVKKDDIKLIVVVNGSTVHLKGIPDDPLSSLTATALKHAGVADGGDLTRWAFKDREGNTLDQTKKIGDFGFADKSTIYLSLEAGAAG